MARNNEQAVIEIILKGQQANASLKDIEKSARALRAQLSRLPVDSQEFASRSRELAQVNTRLRSIRNDLTGVRGAFQSIGQEIRAVGIIGGAMLAFDFIKNGIKSIISGNAQLSDSLADLRKTTGMTEEEAKRMNTAFGQINTRTATKELRNIAIVGGQLGIAKNDIFGFTVAVDKMNVALGDEFNGGAEEVTKAMGGLRNIFTDIKSDKVDKDLLHIGNAINELASKGAATGPVVADFANRIGGVGITLGLTSGQVLGLSATLQELNVSTERGGTAVTKILQKMTQNTTEFAKVAKMPVKEFTDLVNKDLYGAFLKVVKGSKDGGTSATEFGKILDNLGVDGAGASEVFAKLGNSTGLLNEKVDLANTSLKGTGSIMAEFNIKNRNLAADVDRMSKSFASWFTNSNISDFFGSIASGIADMLSKVPEVERLTDVWREQKDTVDNLEASLIPLLHRHDELKGKATLNKDEQTELKKIIDEVAKTVPYAVSEFNKYGEAMDINTSKGRDFISMEKNKLELLNKDALTARRLELIQYTKEITNYQEALQNKDKDGDLFKRVLVGTGQGAFVRDIKLTNEEIIKLNQNLLLAKDKQLGVFAIINELTGAIVKGNKSVIESDEEATKAKIALTKEEEEAKMRMLKELADAYKKFQEELIKLETENGLAKMSENDREFAVVENKYRELRLKAKGHKNDLKRVESLYEDEIMALILKHFEKKAAVDTRELNDEKKRVKDANAMKISMQQEIDNVFLTDYAKEFQSLNKRYDDKIALAKEKGIELNSVEEARLLEIEALRKKHNINESGDLDFMNGTKKAAFNDYYTAVDSILKSRENTRKQKDEEEIRGIDDKSNQELFAVKKLYDGKRISKIEYDKRVEKIERERQKRQKDIRDQAAEREKKAAIKSAIISGIQGVAKTLGEYAYPYNIILAALHAGAAAVQVAEIENADAPSYAEGGMHTSESIGGHVNKKTLFTNSSSGVPFIAGEAGAEYIIPNWMVQDPVISPQIGMLEQIRVRGYATGGYNTDVPAAAAEKSNKVAAAATNDNSDLTAAVNTLNGILSRGIGISYDLLTKQTNDIDSAKASARVG